MKIVIWDWNGTLLDDVQIGIEAMNILLRRRQLPLLTVERYKRLFTFPVKDYYAAIGFDFDAEPFEKPAIEYMDEYFRLMPQATLYKGTKELLDWLNGQNVKQIIMSAMEQEALEKSVAELGITNCFSDICGCSNHYANGKVEQCQLMMRKLNIQPADVLFVGDTLHDKEVADKIGCRCVLMAHGHQSRNRLETSGCTVLDNFGELRRWIEKIFN